jgi:hypothetical protein
MDANYSHISKFHIGQIVCRKMDGGAIKEKAQITAINFLFGGSVKCELTWADGIGGTAYEQELLAVDEKELIITTHP